MKIPFFQKLTLLDYPGKTAATVFTHGCNFRCPFCHNASLVARPAADEVAEDEFLSFLSKRTGLLDGVCVTGGEPLLQPDIAGFLQKIKNMGFLVKLDTNGSFPEKLEALLKEGLVDYVAMDIKNAPEKYGETIGIKTPDFDKIKRSAALLPSLAPDFEFRTTAVKEFHTADDFEQIGKWLAGDSKYYIQCFKDSGDLLGKGLSAPDAGDLSAFLAAALPYLPRAELRGV